MANLNDMPEFHSVKVSLTENIPTRHQPSASNVSNASKRDFADSCVLFTIKGGRDHV